MNQYEVMYVLDPALDDSARAEMINRFSDLVVKNGGEVVVKPEQAIVVTRILEAIYESAKTGKAVYFD